MKSKIIIVITLFLLCIMGCSGFSNPLSSEQQSGVNENGSGVNENGSGVNENG